MTISPYWWFIPTSLFGAVLLYLSCAWFWERLRHIYTASWFRPDEKALTHDPTWMDVAKIATSDPLSDKCEVKFRGVDFPTCARDLAIVFFLLALFSTIVLALTSGAAAKILENLSTEKLTVIGVLIGVAISLYIAMRQLKAKVRSENRQKWIDQVRRQLSLVLYYIPDHDADEDGIEDSRKKAEHSRLELELLMNPAERDHRALGYLLRRAFQHQKFDVDKEIKKAINYTIEITEITNMDTKHALKGLKFFLKLYPKKSSKQALSKKQHDRMIGYIVRLSNAVLKREWERVKYGY